jgi:hypothetical protein
MLKNPLTRTSLLLFLTLLLAGGYFRHMVEYDNTSSRYYLLSAIVDHGTFAIDPYQDETIDKSFHDGHYYSNKAFGTPFLAVPVYWMLRTLPLTRGEVPLTTLHRQVVNVATSAACFAALGVLLFHFGLWLCGDPRSSLLMALAFSFGSIAWVHATMFSGHIMAAALGFLAFGILFHLRRRAGNGPAEGGPDRARYHALLALAAGLAAGIGALCDYTAMYLAVVLAVYALWSRLPLLQKGGFTLGGTVCVAQLLMYNRLNFGNPFSLSYGHMTREEFAEGASQGVLGVTAPSLEVILKLLGSPSRGLLFIMPVFLFSVAGLVVLWRKRRDLRAEGWLLLAVVVGYLLINGGFYGWHGGWAHGPRYLLPALPFLALPMVLAPIRTPLFALTLAVSVLRVLPGVVGFPYTPQVILNPLRDTVLPLMRYGYLAENGIYWLGGSKSLGIAVGLLAMAALAALTWRSVSAATGAQARHSAPWPVAVLVLASLVGITVTTAFVRTERQVRLKVMARLALDADLRLPYRDATDFMENEP